MPWGELMLRSAVSAGAVSGPKMTQQRHTGHRELGAQAACASLVRRRISALSGVTSKAQTHPRRGADHGCALVRGDEVQVVGGDADVRVALEQV